MGGYTGTTVISSAEFEHFDKYLAEAIHGKGGTYSLEDDLVIGGDDVTVTENFIVGGTAAFSGDASVGDDLSVTNDTSIGGTASIAGSASVGGTLTVSQNANLSSDVSIGGDLSVAEDAAFEANVSVSGNAAVDGTLTVAGQATVEDMVVNDDLTVGNDLDVTGDALLGGASGAVQFRGATTARAPISFADSGKVVYRQQVVATDANQTCIAAQVDTFFVPDGVFGANREVTIIDTGAVDGMRVRFFSRDTTNFCTVLRPGGSPAGGSFGGASPNWVEVERIGGVWYLLDPTT